ncbi:MAG: hypothetical protein DWI01_08295 [Planctomycetota bacterium]|nr:MAG: hypothetical protein DWI01_08295 [Planctomycetota bacterium]
MTLDWLDTAFLTRQPRPNPAAPAATPNTSQAMPPAVMPPGPRLEASATSEESVVARLLEAVPSEWGSLAAAIESAALAGVKVVAFTGGERNEGRSTIVVGVAEVLRRRGRSVAIHAQAPLLLPIDEAEEARAAEIVLVDAGPWFTTGPVRRRTVERAALGCDAAVLVRRADKPPCPAWNEVLAAIGLTVIGEALTFETALVSG